MQDAPHSPTTRQQAAAVVIGGGITGLATAHALARGGERVIVLEKADRLGGAVLSDMRDGFLCEAGPNSMLVKSQRVWEFIESLGLQDDRVEANALANKRFLVKDGRLVALPQSPAGGITTRLYSPLEKFRLLAEPFIGRSRLSDESVTSFVSRRMGPAFLEYGISALVSGIFAGDPDRLSIRHGFPKVWNLEQNHGSLIGGALKLKRERKRRGIIPFKSRMISFRHGLQQLVTALAGPENVVTRTAAELRRIQRGESGWSVETAGGTITAPRVILATPLSAHAELPFEPDVQSRLAGLPEIDHPPLSTLVLGFNRDQIQHPLDGFGVLFPRLEKRFSLGCIFSSTLFPGRAPEGKVSLMCFIGGVQQPDNGRLPTDQLVRRTVEDLRPLLGITGEPHFHSHSFWPLAIPQYNVGHAAFLAALEDTEAAVPGLFLRGNFRGGPGLSDCLDNALAFAEGITGA
jgi:oxygen-dependent protoporphyrinogen oxidase